MRDKDRKWKSARLSYRDNKMYNFYYSVHFSEFVPESTRGHQVEVAYVVPPRDQS